MGAITSRPVLHTIETGLLAVARLVDVLVRMIDRLLATIISKCFSPSIYAHFYVTPPASTEAAVQVGPDGLTRVCTQDGVCYIPATRAKQHRHWRKRNQEDRLKKRMMRAEWAAAGLDVREMQRAERERQKQKSSSNPIIALKQFSRTATMEAASTDELVLASKRTSIDDSNNVRRTRPTSAHARSNPFTYNNNDSGPVDSTPKLTLRALTAVREASHDHGATVPVEQFELVGQGGEPLRELTAVNARKHKRGMSAPVPALMKLKGLASVDAVSASRIGVDTVMANGPSYAPIGVEDVKRCESPVSEKDIGLPRISSLTPLSSAPVLVQPRPRRPVRTAFDIANIANPSAPFTVDLTPAAVRSSSTPPVPFMPARTRTSFDISPAQTPFGARAGSPGIEDDASSIRSRRSVLGIPIARSTTPSTPPPFVVQLADRACKSRWESSAKERKVWKDEVKRLALHKVHEQHAAYRASLDLKNSYTPPPVAPSSSTDMAE